MEVRWPEGRWLFAPLATRFGSSDPETIGLVHGIIDLFYPAERPAGLDLGEGREEMALFRESNKTPSPSGRGPG